MTTTAPAPTVTNERHLIFKLKRHGDCPTTAIRATHRTLRIPTRPGYSRTEQEVTTSREGVTFEDRGGNAWSAVFECPSCSRNVRVWGKAIQGHHNPTKNCTPRCEAATGPNCDCSCAGDNHGGGWS